MDNETILKPLRQTISELPENLPPPPPPVTPADVDDSGVQPSLAQACAAEGKSGERTDNSIASKRLSNASIPQDEKGARVTMVVAADVHQEAQGMNS